VTDNKVAVNTIWKGLKTNIRKIKVKSFEKNLNANSTNIKY